MLLRNPGFIYEQFTVRQSTFAVIRARRGVQALLERSEKETMHGLPLRN